MGGCPNSKVRFERYVVCVILIVRKLTSIAIISFPIVDKWDFQILIFQKYYVSLCVSLALIDIIFFFLISKTRER